MRTHLHRFDDCAPAQLTPLASAMRAGLLGLALAAASAAQAQDAGTAVPAPVPDAKQETPITMLPSVKVRAKAEVEKAKGPVIGYGAKRSATGTKTDTPLIETPQSISVLTADRMQAIGTYQLKDALAYTPGLNAAPYGHDSRYEWINIRGFDGYSPGFYQDGLLLRNNSGWAVWQSESYNTERLEVLRGPSSVLYGQGSAGGVVSLVSKRPSAKPLHELQLQLGDNSRRVLSADFSGPVDDEGKLLYRLTAVARDAELANTRLPDDRQFIAPSLTWKPSADTSLTLSSQVTRVRAGAFWSGYPVEGTLKPAANGPIRPETFLGEPNFERFNQDQWSVGYEFEHRANDSWTLRQNARYGHIDLDYRQTSSGGFHVIEGTDPPDHDPRRVDRFTTTSGEKISLFTIDNQAQAKLRFGDWQHTLLIGLDYQHGRFDQITNAGDVSPIDAYAPVPTNDATTGAPWIDSNARLSQTGLYVQDQIKFDTRWVFTLGGRFDHAQVDLNDRLPGALAAKVTRTDHQFTSRAGVVYLAPNGLAPYLSYSESFSPSTTADPDHPSTLLKAETGQQVEAGLRYQPVGSHAIYSAAVFDLRRQNYTTQDADFRPKQTGEIRVRGLEAEAVVEPWAGLNLTAAWSLTWDADITASSTTAEIGTQLNPVPRHQVSLWGDYRFGGGFKAGLGLRYVGSTQRIDLSTEGDPPVTRQLPAIDVPSYTLVDAMLGYDIGRWNLALNVHNLSDKTHVTNCGGGSCYYGSLRKVVGTLSYRW